MTNKLAILVGPCYELPAAARVLGVTEEEVRMRLDNALLVSVVTAEGDVLIPAFQFDAGQLRPDVIDLAHLFRGLSGWSFVRWFRTVSEDLDGLTPEEWLRTGRAFSVARTDAARTAARWLA